jgi:hypothetical protein
LVRRAYQGFCANGNMGDGFKVWEAVTLAIWLRSQSASGVPRSSFSAASCFAT